MKICVFRQIELYDLSVFFCGTKVNHVSMTAWKMKKACLPQAYSNNVIEVSTSFNLIECLSLSLPLDCTIYSTPTVVQTKRVELLLSERRRIDLGDVKRLTEGTLTSSPCSNTRYANYCSRARIILDASRFVLCESGTKRALHIKSIL